MTSFRPKMVSSWTFGISAVSARSALTGRTTTRTPTASFTSWTLPMTSDFRNAQMSWSPYSKRKTCRTYQCWFTLTNKICSSLLMPTRLWKNWSSQISATAPGIFKPALPLPRKVFQTAWSGSSRQFLLSKLANDCNYPRTIMPKSYLSLCKITLNSKNYF